MTPTDLRQQAAAWSTLQDLRDTLDALADQHAKVVEDAAHDHLERRHLYQRRYQRPVLTDVVEAGAEFHVSNGIDDGDDFDCTVSWADLDRAVMLVLVNQVVRL